MTNVVVEHGESRSRAVSAVAAIRRRRVRRGVEAVLVLADVLPWWVVRCRGRRDDRALPRLGREHTAPIVRSVHWVAAASQLVVVLVPVAIVLVGLIALVGIVVLAAVALAVLLLDRR